MQKIPTVFERDSSFKVTPVVKCLWVFNEPCVATRKLDGVNVKVSGGIVYKRQKPASGEYTDASYVPLTPADNWLWAAAENTGPGLRDGIYEAVGPKFQGNPEQFGTNTLVRVLPVSDLLILKDVPNTFDGLRDFIKESGVEGIVWHHADGRMAKLKGKDYGLKRKKDGAYVDKDQSNGRTDRLDGV